MTTQYSSRQLELISQIRELDHDLNTETVVDDALELLLNERKLNRLRKALDRSLAEEARGEVRELTPELIEEIRANGREKFRLGIAPDPDVIP
jgi:hypothetical protein